MNLTEIKKLANKSLIDCTVGKLASVYQVSRGKTADNKPWVKQDLILDINGDKVKVVVWNNNEVDRSWEGKTVMISAHTGPKGLSGVYAEDNEYQGNVTRQIRVTRTGKIDLFENGHGVQQGQPPQPSQQPNPQPPQSTGDTPPDSATPPDHVSEFKDFVARGLNGFYLIREQLSFWKEVMVLKGIEITPDQEQGISGTLFINADRAGKISRLPATPLWGKKDDGTEDHKTPF